jgi:hypothetical protein
MRTFGVTGFGVAVGPPEGESFLARLAGDARRVFVTARDGLVPTAWPGGAPPGCG